jgi:hypothetical protein
MRTMGGFRIKDFEIFDEPKDNETYCEPHVCCGTFYDPVLKQRFLVRWDIQGRCNNWDRKDCFISPRTLRQRMKENEILLEKPDKL